MPPLFKLPPAQAAACAGGTFVINLLTENKFKLLADDLHIGRKIQTALFEFAGKEFFVHPAPIAERFVALALFFGKFFADFTESDHFDAHSPDYADGRAV